MVRRLAMLTDHADPLSPIGGVEAGGENVYVSELTKSLAKLGWVIDVFTRWNSHKTTRIAKLANNVRVIRLKAGPMEHVPKDELFQYMPEYVQSFIQFQKEAKLDYLLLHGNYYFSGWAGVQLSRILHLPLTNTFHTLGVVKHNAMGAKDTSPEERTKLETEVMMGAERVIATSPPMKEEIQKFYNISGKKVVVIPGGVNLNRFQPTPQLLARRVLHISPNRQIVLYVGRLDRRKGIDTLLHAMSELAKAMPEKRRILRCYIAGGEPKHRWGKDKNSPESLELDRLNAIVDKLGIRDMMRFMGSINREYLQYYYSAADVTVVPSFYEPFGLVPLESMAAGTPVVASNVGGISWTVRDGKTGILVPARDHEMFAKKIKYLLEHPTIRKQMRENGIERMEHLFSWDSVAKQMSEMYQDVIIDYFYRLSQPKENGKNNSLTLPKVEGTL